MADVTSATSVNPFAVSAPSSNGAAPSDQQKTAFDTILSMVMNQPPVLAGGGGDDDDNDDGSSLSVGMYGTPSLG